MLLFFSQIENETTSSSATNGSPVVVMTVRVYFSKV